MSYAEPSPCYNNEFREKANARLTPEEVKELDESYRAQVKEILGGRPDILIPPPGTHPPSLESYGSPANLPRGVHYDEHGELHGEWDEGPGFRDYDGAWHPTGDSESHSDVSDNIEPASFENEDWTPPETSSCGSDLEIDDLPTGVHVDEHGELHSDIENIEHSDGGEWPEGDSREPPSQ